MIRRSPEEVQNRLTELSLYVTEKLGTVDEQKLNAVLFMADMRSYRETGESITGASWMKGPAGPVPFAIR